MLPLPVFQTYDFLIVKLFLEYIVAGSLKERLPLPSKITANLFALLIHSRTTCSEEAKSYAVIFLMRATLLSKILQKVVLVVHNFDNVTKFENKSVTQKRRVQVALTLRGGIFEKSFNVGINAKESS
jgi:hypothetical protein